MHRLGLLLLFGITVAPLAEARAGAPYPDAATVKRCPHIPQGDVARHVALARKKHPTEQERRDLERVWFELWSVAARMQNEPTVAALGKACSRSAARPGVLACANVRLASKLVVPTDTSNLSCTACRLGGLRSLAGTIKDLKLSSSVLDTPAELSRLRGLRTLRLWETNVTSLKALSALVELEGLEFSSTMATSLDGIERFRKLRRLHILGECLGDLSPLGKLTRLTSLMVFRAKPPDAGFLAGLTNLRTLVLNPAVYLKDIKLLGNMPKLKTLVLKDHCLPAKALNDFWRQRPGLALSASRSKRCR